jgi:hypothetical protein
LLLSELTGTVGRLALVGLAKNTGKTEALAAILRERQTQRRTVGVTSIGRDGEARDVIDNRISKPRVLLAGGSLVATTDALLRASGLPHELLARTGVRTPLGEVLIARLQGAGAIEVAGPSAAAGVRAVSEVMLAHGAEQVLIDGAIDRRAASSPDVADGLVMSTGAVLSNVIEEVIERTVAAVEIVRLAQLSDPAVLAAGDGARGHSVLVREDLEPVALAPRFVLASSAQQIGHLLDEHPSGRWLIVDGALPEVFVRSLLAAARPRRRELVLVVTDATRVFLSDRPPEWYSRQGIEIRAISATALLALTVNPVAPRSHRFDSVRLRELLREAIPDVPVLDVMHGDYAEFGAPSAGQR